MNPSAEMVKDFPVNTARIIPIYRQSKQINSNQIRKLIATSREGILDLPETLPRWMLGKFSLCSRAEAVMSMHFPDSSEALVHAKKRLGFEEVFRLSLASLLNKQQAMLESSIPIKFNEKVAVEFVKNLPFSLTDDQRKVVWQIYKDMEFTYPMNRLVEGDVGAGKTVVAAMAAIMAVDAGYQVAVMAPTEILANQHHQTLKQIFSHDPKKYSVDLLVGGMTAADKKQALGRIKDGSTAIVVGTHALIQDGVDMKNLGLMVVDEQHRFGVEQRKDLMRKAGHMPHVLSLTATPIPRSLALTLFGEMDISVLRQKPAGRLPIETSVVSQLQRKKLYEKLALSLEQGEQLYVVCPLVEESDALAVKSVEKVHQELSKGVFKDFRVGLLHGKMKPAEKESVMSRFKAHELDVLVSTTVIEVGVDVPNASRIVIESAERFGLAQLHQLRGRVGRGGKRSYCFLVLSPDVQPSRRIQAIATSNDGFKLAEFDLKLRGAGAIYGQSQHGAIDLRIAQLTDVELIEAARQAAVEFVDMGEKLVKYPELNQSIKQLRKVTHLN